MARKKNKYHGMPCSKCGGTQRYINGNNCVRCLRAKSLQRRAERVLKSEDGITYEGRECKSCGSVLRYVSNGVCVDCTSETKRRNRAKNPEKYKAINHRRRARKRNAEGDYSEEEWYYLLDMTGNRCSRCGVDFNEDMSPTVDHIVALSVGGSNYISNIQAACSSCNSAMGNRDNTDYRVGNYITYWGIRYDFNTEGKDGESVASTE